MKNYPILLFGINDQIVVQNPNKESQVLTIEYIDYSRSVYIFKEPWINSLSKFTNIDFTKAHSIFKLKT